MIPKLFRGSSFSRDESNWEVGAGTAADRTERAGESSLDVLLESLLSVLLLLLLLMESLLEDLLLEPLPLGDLVGLDAWLASLCGDWFLDWDECGERLLLCW